MDTAKATILYARARPGVDARIDGAVALLVRAAESHRGRIVQATSLGAEDQVVTDLIARFDLPIVVATIDTGELHAETLDLIAAVRKRYGIAIERHRPLREQTISFVARHGDRAMYESIELRKACCAMRKLEPLGRLLAGRDAWVTGLRREQSSERGEAPLEALDEHGRTKFNPLADWRWGDVWHYIESHDVPYNTLHDRFHPSIGCAPCTRAIAVGEDFRAGRWWWEQGAKECGLHAERVNESESSAA